ncbi:unnamed protein product [Linum trigynum]|uniref:Pectinesterase inhibitor domain-containing protein n=1 Tax=Linum trigynum TaxID=586398 RepID=A0AAV2DX31_9ROSI
MGIPNKPLLLFLLIITITFSSLLTLSTSHSSPSPSPSSTADDDEETTASPSSSTGEEQEEEEEETDATDSSPSQSPLSSLFGSPSPSPEPALRFSSKFHRRMQETAESPAAADRSSKLVAQLCAGTENPARCTAYFHYSKSDDAAQIIDAELGTLNTLLIEAKSAAVRAQHQGRASPDVAHGLDVCVENYDKANANLDRASVACAKCMGPNKATECTAKEVGEVKTMLSAVISNIGFCDEAFDGQGLPRPPTKEINEAVVELADWLLEFSKKLDE